MTRLRRSASLPASWRARLKKSSAVAALLTASFHSLLASVLAFRATPKRSPSRLPQLRTSAKAPVTVPLRTVSLRASASPSMGMESP